MPAERRENSVLFSLRELRKIEDDRVTQEKTEAAARAAAEEQARQDAIRRRQEEEERKRREDEDRARAAEDARQRQIREEQLRLQESQQRAHIEAQTRLEAERLRLEAEHRQAELAHRKRHLGPLIGAVVGLLVIFGGLTGYLVYRHNQEQAAAAAAIARANAANQALENQIADLSNQIDAAQKANDQLQQQLAQATTDAQRKAIQAQIDANNAKLATARENLNRVRRHHGGGASHTVDCSKSNDPLCGLH